MASSRYKELFQRAQEEKTGTVKAVQRDIRDIFKDAASHMESRTLKAKRGSLAERWALDYQKAVNASLREVRKQISTSAEKAAYEAANAANEVQLSFFSGLNEKYGLGMEETFRTVFSRVPKEAMNEILSGGMYKDRKGISERIWADTRGVQRDIDYIIARGIAEKKSAFDLAKDLEAYLDPDAAKPWNWSQVYPGTRRQIDYNAQRLARTSVNHAFHAASIRSCQRNPYVEGIQWVLSGAHFSRQVRPFGEDECDEYARQDDYGLGAGVFPKDRVPLPHPNCLCTQAPYVAMSMTDIGSELKAWAKGASNTKLDMWYESYGLEFAV